MSKAAITLWTVVLAAALGCGATLAFSRQPALPARAADATIATDLATLQHGQQLAALGACAVCHTAQGGQPYAGGLRLDTPFGALYTSNITPDDATGIGRWSPAAFERAMRLGVSRDGHLLYPAFPYVHFSGTNSADLAALYAYLMSRRPVTAQVPPNRLIFPLNFRPLMAGWNLLFFKPQDPTPDDAQSADWNRGRYLVESLGHCAACHTPLNLLGAERAGQPFAGGSIDGWDAPPLTGLASSPQPWTRAQLVSYLKTGVSSQHSAALGPMRPVTTELANVSDADVGAIATYLLSLGAPPTPAPTDNPAPPALALPAGAAHEATLKAGAGLFAAACAACHAAGSPMQSTGRRPALGTSTTLNSDSARNAIMVVLNGNGWRDSRAAPYMPGFAGTLSDQDVADVVNYIRARFTARGAPDIDAALVSKIRTSAQRAQPHD
jgi:mono/diheme cytochrome c family protein